MDYYAAQPGTDPTLRNNPDYYVQRILETGGWTTKTGAQYGGGDNTVYWPDRWLKEGALAAGGGQTALGAAATKGYPGAHTRRPGSTVLGQAVLRDGTELGTEFSASDSYASAYLAATQRRRKAGAGGRQSTILGGFGQAAPMTRPATALGY